MFFFSGVLPRDILVRSWFIIIDRSSSIYTNLLCLLPKDVNDNADDDDDVDVDDNDSFSKAKMLPRTL